jgi:ribosomal protein L7/L12
MDPLLQYVIVFLVAVLVCYQVVAVRFAVARIERKVAHVAAFLRIDTSKPPPPSERVRDLARQPGRKIEAIRAYSADTGLGVVEAAAALEAHLASQEP